MQAEDLDELVRQKLENLRPKLLDLSRRNPLIATKLGPRSNSHIRVVDELPDILFYKLNNSQEMRLVPLPDIDDDPRDERTRGFRDALINARLTDDRYLADMESIERDADDYLDRTRNIERSLKDRVRAALNLPQRAKKAEINLIQHARINGIAPSYELPMPTEEHADGRHTDNDIQTLLLPDDLERKLNAILSKCRTWLQETGMNVLQIVYGFLEWSDGVQTDTSFAPLILCEAEITKRRTTQGAQFSISRIGGDPEINAVLAEKLRLDFALELPPFTGSSVETYLAEVAALAPRNMIWRVRRQVAIGVFPSARMAMYHDLDPKQPNFPKSDIVHSLLAGSDSGASTPFADEYEVDELEIERKVPCLVMDADSSQFSTLVDVADGKNVAVEGPPGTGKSQTIVNAIAAALADGKKVLFVAEKLAALNVVKSRLEAVGLGEFLLPLQAEKSTREQVVQSIRDRVGMNPGPKVRDLDSKLAELRNVRQQIAKYIHLISQPFQDTGLTVREILGKSLATNVHLATISQETLEKCKVPENLLSAVGLSLLRQAGFQVEQAHRDTVNAKANWKGTKLLHPERFAIEAACASAARTGAAVSDLANARDGLPEAFLPTDLPITKLSEIDVHLAQAQKHLQAHTVQVLVALLQDGNVQSVQDFIYRCDACQVARDELGRVLVVEPSVRCLGSLSQTADVCERFSLSTIDVEDLDNQLQAGRQFAKTARSVSSLLKPLMESRPETGNWRLNDIVKAQVLLSEAGQDALLSRNARTSEPDGVHLLQQLCGEGRQLQTLRAEIGERVTFAVEVSIATLSDCVSTLRVAGPFRALSGRYRKAKRLASSVVRMDKFISRDAIDALDALIAFKKMEAEYRQNPHASAAFGFHFRGIETQFNQFERLVAYYRNVDTHFGQPDVRPLRTFLRNADWEELELIPPLPAMDHTISYEVLLERIAMNETQVRSLEEAIANLRPCVSIFMEPKSVDVGELPYLISRTRSLIDEEAALDEKEDIQRIVLEAFNGSKTRTENLRDLVRWANSAQAFESAISAIVTAGAIEEARRRIESVLITQRRADQLLAAVADITKIGAEHFAGGGSWREKAQRLHEAAQDPEGLFLHAAFATTLEEARPQGLLPLIEGRLESSAELAGLVDQCDALAARQLAKAVYAEFGQELSRYRGSRLDELRASLVAHDRDIIRLHRRQLRTKVHASAQPGYGNGFGRKSTWTGMPLIENEMSKTQRFISVRDLTQRAGRALLELKPCWMMSPLAVAQYVPKGSIHFDLCIIDEASQMPPESAMGALLRCSQTVVVGDTNQLPPSTFFKSLIEDEEADEDETVLDESILEMANATFRPARRLRWHYRSRHSGLIKFSNRLVYDDDLVVFPSPTEALARMGVEFRQVPGIYKAGTNPAEAKVVVEAALEFMLTNSNRSLGIVTLNQKQRDLISEEFEYAIASNKYASDYIEAWRVRNDGLEEFFIKNLENVQGDERDVIFIGTVYGPETLGGKVMQRFGPINGLAGKRRLNVLFTRAKEKIVTFSSMVPSDIAADESSNPGTYMLKRWLEYSATGVLEGGKRTEREPDSDFELFVMQQIRSIGCDVEPQVGVAGYFIDIGVRHPDWPYGFVLGVECDGATYHSAKSARDRDRLRQEVLQALGWRLYRIWSTDWFNNPQREAEKLRAAIAARLNELKTREQEYATAAESVDEPESALGATVETGTKNQELPLRRQRLDEVNRPEPVPGRRILEVGDTARVRYLTDDKRTLIFTISGTKSDPSQGIIYHKSPIAKALLGAEEGDEVEVLVGSYVRPAVVMSIIKTQ